MGHEDPGRDGMFPFCLLPFGLLPFGLLPFGLLPIGLLPFGLLPFGLLPFGLLPFGLLLLFKESSVAVSHCISVARVLSKLIIQSTRNCQSN